MNTPPVMNLVTPDTMPTPAVAPNATQQFNHDASGLSQFAQEVQGMVESKSTRIGALLDPNRKHRLSTSEMLWLQAAMGDYSVTMLTISSTAQSLTSSIQTLLQKQ
ncbi:Type III secretion protein [Paraburkholderia sacchari]|uniref:hypothetical protein n=1 Tax=Paraburkholderia sacchari TaxID=159450 RepID=UPI0039A4FEA8